MHNGKDEACHMCVPDLSILRSVVLGDNKSYNLGAIVARRLHLNRFNGDFFGGIYATRLADFLGVTIRNDDIELPLAYLDFNAMVHHQFVERNESPLQYRLIFDRRRVVLLLSLLLPSLIIRQKEDMLLPERRQMSTRGGWRLLIAMLQLRRR